MAHTKVTRAYGSNTGVANTYSYSGSFDTFKATEVVVELDNVALTYTASTINESASPREYTVDYTNKTVHIGGADLSSGTVVIKPVTDLGSPTPRATYAPGASITSEDLNNNQKQLLRRAMEYEEQVMFKTGGTFTGTVEMGEDQVIKFEGATADGYETTLTVTDPTADRTITLPNVTGTVVTTGDTATVTATMLAANSVDSSELVDGSIDPSHIASSAVTTAKIAADAVTGAKIADDAIDSEHYANLSIDTAHIANDAIDNTKIATNAVNSDSIQDGQVIRDKIAADAINGAKIVDDAVDSEHIAADSIDSEHYAPGSVDATALASNAVTTVKINADAVTGAKIADDAIDSEHLVDGSIDTAHIGDSQITSAKINDGTIVNADISGSAAIDHSKLAAVSSGNVLVGNGSNQAASVAMSGDVAIAAGGATTIQANAVEIGMIGCEQTTISDSDSHIPTSGAVVDYVAAQIAPIGGLEVIADEDNFPSTQPAAGVVISIADAGGVVFNGSGVSTTARTAGNGSDNVTINGAPASLYSETLAAGVGMQVSSTGSSHTYNYHKILATESDVKQLSDDINDFNSRYRIAGSAPGSNNDEGDLYFDTGTNKMYVYDGSAWGEVTSTGDFKYLVLCVFNSGTGNAGVINGSVSKYDLRETSTSGSLASVTSAAQLMVSINGVVQKPNTGSAISSNDGFCMVDGHTIEFGANIPSGAEVFVIQSGSALTINTPGDGTVVAAKIASGAVSTAKLAADAVDGTKIADDAIDSEHIADGAIDNAHMANNSVNSAQIVDGAVTAGEIAANAVGSSEIAADAVDGTKIADNAINSEHYTDGSIDTAHIADNQITLAKMAGGTDGVIITYDANGDPVHVGPGTDGQVLTSTGSGSPPAFEDAASGGVTSDGQNNTVAGTNAGDSFTGTDANHNSLFGKDAGTALTTGDYNSAFGSGALITCATGAGNTAMGWKALEMCESGGEYNVAIGYAAGEGLTTGDNNIAIGASALDAAVTGGSNVAIGSSSLSTNTSGANNVAVGNQSLQNSTTAGNNVAVGAASMTANTEGHSIVAIGESALTASQHADCIVAIGKGAMETQNSTGAGYCIAIGAYALKGANTAEHNIAIGYECMGKADTTGARMIGIGNQTLENVTSGSDTVAIGQHCMEAATTANNTVAIGTYAGESVSDGNRNVFIGHQAGKNGASQSYCTYVGYDAGRDNTASHNTFIGHASGQDNAGTGQGNTCCGSYTMQAGTSGDCTENSCFGYAAGFNITSGDNNTLIGNAAGKEITTGSNNLMLGKDAGRSNSPIGSVTTASNDICLGDNNIDNLYCDDTSISSSDQRDKVDVENFTHGLKWVNQLRPITYRWDKRTWYNEYDRDTDAIISSKSPDGSKKKPKKHIGFLAQEVLAVEQGDGFAGSKNDMLTVHLNNDDSAYGLKYERLVPVLVNAIKELSTKNDALEARIATLEAK